MQMQFYVLLTYLECWNMMNASHNNKCRSVPTVHFKPCLVTTTDLEMTQPSLVWVLVWNPGKDLLVLAEVIRGQQCPWGRWYRLWNDLLIINLKSMKNINRRWRRWLFDICVCMCVCTQVDMRKYMCYSI